MMAPANFVHINFCLLFSRWFLSTVALKYLSVEDGVSNGSASRVDVLFA